MIDRRIGISLPSLRQPPKRALETAARLGARAVELDARQTFRPREMSQTAIRQLRKWLDDLGLNISAISFLTRHGYDELNNLDRRVAATKEAMTFAYALGTSVVVNHVGRVPEEREGDEWNALTSSLEDLGKHAQKCGAWLCARTGTESGESLAELMEAIPEGSIRVDLDPGATIINGFSLPKTVAALGPYVAHVHARDAVRDPGQGRGLEVPLGRGVADYPWLFAALEEHRFTGFFTLQRDHAKDPIRELGDAVNYLQNL